MAEGWAGAAEAVGEVEEVPTRGGGEGARGRRPSEARAPSGRRDSAGTRTGGEWMQARAWRSSGDDGKECPTTIVEGGVGDVKKLEGKYGACTRRAAARCAAESVRDRHARPAVNATEISLNLVAQWRRS